MIKVSLESKVNQVLAFGMYDPKSNALVVRKGSTISSYVAEESKFRGINSIKRRRELFTKKNKVIKDVEFKSPSTAASFILGRSANGPKLWKTEDGKSLSDMKKEV